ncbi:VUT family protein [Streptomyces sp. NPDC058373]|uniref:VUT family protein n=1 Tax=Streptomyces sp. NPDC058373 TaxID=3346465 RepID=UPI003659E6FB
MRARTVAAVTAYTASITAANWLTAHYGLVTLAPGVTATAGTLAAGAALLARDLVQDTAGRAWVLAGITVGAALTWATSPALALASSTAFLIAELADMAVYTPLRDRGWARAVLASNIVGAIVDTLVFLWLAGFPVAAATVTGQLVGKIVWATLLPVAAVTAVRRWRRAVPRHAVGA